MSISVTVKKRSGTTATGRCVIADVTFDDAYPAGGEPYTAKMFGLNQIDFLKCETAYATATSAYMVRADHTNSTIMLYNSNGAAAAALVETSTVDQSSTVARVMAFELPNA